MREVVARSSDVKKYFNRILEERKADLGDERSDLRNAKAVPTDSYVFCGRDGIPIGSFKKSFSTLLKDAGVEFDTFGNKRTLYSLRHTYATFRLHEGVNQYSPLFLHHCGGHAWHVGDDLYHEDGADGLGTIAATLTMCSHRYPSRIPCLRRSMVM